MAKIVIAPDSFKGTLSSLEVCNIIKKAFSEVIPDSEILTIPIADGGEGTLDAFMTAVGGELRCVQVTSPLFRPIFADYLVINGDTAVIEMAQASGLTLIKGEENPLNTTTYGTGELILHALNSGCKNILIGLGGSATNDGGIGCLGALGIKFLDENGNSIPLTGGGLSKLCKIDVSGLTPKIKDASITLLCDVDNPFCGENGASFVFAPQKGATPEQVKQLDKNLCHLSNIIERDFNFSLTSLPSSGAAGGLSGGLTAFTNAECCSGADKILETVNFKDMVRNCDLIITGEGCLDSQTEHGKVISKVLAHAEDVPCIAIVGVKKETTTLPLNAVYETNENHLPFEAIIKTAEEDLYIIAVKAAKEFKLELTGM